MPTNYITKFDINGDASGQVNVTVAAAGNASSNVDITILERGTDTTVATHSGSTGAEFTFQVDSPKLWCPDTPNLYDVVVKLGDDEARSYTGFRTIGREEFNGVQQITLNGDAFFAFGTLDQGYWRK